MDKLRCKVCEGVLVMDDSGENAECEHCGTKYRKPTIQKMLVEMSGPVTIEGAVQVEGVQSLSKLIANAEKFFELGEIEKSQNTYMRITEEYPEDHRGWWGLILCKTNNFEMLGFRTITDVWYRYVINTASADYLEKYRMLYEKYTKSSLVAEANDKILEIQNNINTTNCGIQNFKNKENEIILEHNLHQRKRTTGIIFALIATGVILFTIFAGGYFLRLMFVPSVIIAIISFRSFILNSGECKKLNNEQTMIYRQIDQCRALILDYEKQIEQQNGIIADNS